MHLLFPVFLLEIRASDLDPHRSVFDFRPDPQMHGLWTERSQISSILLLRKKGLWSVDPHSIFADPDPAVFLNADPDPERAYKTV